jgi:choline dehydrogenase-like flavoprotein
MPTASGTNPMISIMALAHRTAEAIAAGANASIGDNVSTSAKTATAAASPPN